MFEIYHPSHPVILKRGVIFLKLGIFFEIKIDRNFNILRAFKSKNVKEISESEF